MLVIKIFSERKKVFREGKKCEKIRAKRLFARLIEEFRFALHRLRSRLVSDSTSKDAEWEPIEEECLEEPKEGWMLGESKKRCLRFMGKRTNVNARSHRSTKVDESKLCDIPVVSTKETEVSCEAQQGRSGVKMKLFRSCRNNMSNEPILALPEGSGNFSSDAWSKVETSKAEDASTEMLRGLDQLVERKEDGGLYF
ncbi:hypothetical protein Tco_0669062 [Tanacetum coccineum]